MAGIDVGDRKVQSLIRKLYFAHFARSMNQLGVEHEDVLQDIALGIMARNRGRSPYTPERGGIANYLYVVIRSVTANFAEHTRYFRRTYGDVAEEADLASSPAGTGVEGDAGGWSSVEVHDLATEARVPDELVQRVARGEHPWRVAHELVGFFEAEDLVERLDDARPNRRGRRLALEPLEPLQGVQAAKAG